MKSFIFAGLAWLALGLVAALAVGRSGLVDVAASRDHGGVVDWFLAMTREASVARQAADIAVPDLGDEALQLAGINDFDAMCAGCHGRPGKDRSSAGRGLNPIAPELGQVAGERSPAEIYWATRNGIRMTGMPAWSASHDDESLWPVVAFISQRLPALDAAAYDDMLATAAGHGHHGEDAGSAEHDHGHAQENGDESAGESDAGHHDDDGRPAAEEEHDHSTHEH